MAEVKERLTMSVFEAAEALGIHPNSLYTAIKKGGWIRTLTRCVLPVSHLKGVLNLNASQTLSGLSFMWANNAGRKSKAVAAWV